MFKLMDKKKSQLYAEFFCLTGPMMLFLGVLIIPYDMTREDNAMDVHATQ